MLPKTAVDAPKKAVPQNNEADEVAQRALRLASGDLLEVSDLHDDGRPDAISSAGSSRGPWIKDSKASLGGGGGGTPRSGATTPRSTGSGSARSVRPRTTETRTGRKRQLQPQRPATSHTARPRRETRLERLAAEKAALTERVSRPTKRRPDGLLVRRDNVSQWTGVASDTDGVVPRIYTPVPRQRIGYRAARKKEIDDDIKFGATMRRQRMDRQRKIELEMYQRAFSMIDLDGNGTVEPAEVLRMLRKMGRDPAGSKFWETCVFQPFSLSFPPAWKRENCRSCLRACFFEAEKRNERAHFSSSFLAGSTR